MAFDEALAQRIREVLHARSDVEDKQMFGGLAFLIAGKMACGVIGDELVVRMDRDDAARLLESEPGTREFDMTGRPMRNWVVVAPEAVAGDDDLECWVRRGEAFIAGGGAP